MPTNNPKLRRIYNQMYYEKHAEELKAKQRARDAAKTPEERARKAALHKAWTRANAQRLSASRRAKYRANPARTLWQNARLRARKLGLPFNIEISDIVVPKTCPVLGIPIVHGSNKGWTPGAPTVDRVDNSKGYIKGNICVISWRANSIKSDATLDELERVAAYVREWDTAKEAAA